MAQDSSLADDASLITLSDWQGAYRAGADPALLLSARLRRLLGTSPGEAWTLKLAPEALALRLSELRVLEARHRSRDELLAAHPLFGIPFAVKDNIDVQGLPTTAACPAFERVAELSATVVHKLLDAGAVLLGKTNLDQFATGLVGTRSPYGAPSSVFDAARISGGSSSGSAVVVARGELPFALGTDTAGSGRVPAAFNQLVGLKPTPGRVSTAGVVPACRSLDCVSVLALSVDDAASVLALIEGPDDADAYSRFEPGRCRLPERPRIGVPLAPPLDDALGYPAAWQQALSALAAGGAQVVPLDFAVLHEVAALLYDGPWVAERFAAVQPLIEGQPDSIEATVREVIARGGSFSAADAFRGQYQLQALRRKAQALLAQVDFLVVPSVPTHPLHGEVQADPIGSNARLGLYTNFVNLLGWCAIAVPAAKTPGGLPFGITAIAAANADAALAVWARGWQASSGLTLGATGRALGASSPLAHPAAEPVMPIAVVGAHLSGLPLNSQLTERGATLLRSTVTAPHYRLHALAGSKPPKPGLLRVRAGGRAIAVEVWSMPQAEWGSFLALIPAPLGLGRVELDDGSSVHGFLCEAHALEGAPDLSHHGGWRAYLASL